jgi:hypothetical protein
VIQTNEAAGAGTGLGAGAGFFDDRKRFMGSATLVSRRVRALSDLTVIDVVGADASLAKFLSHLDKSRLLVQESSGDTLFSFRWASGYVNGTDIRVQGVLEHP